MERKPTLCSMNQCQLLDSHQKPVKEREGEGEEKILMRCDLKDFHLQCVLKYWFVYTL